MKKQVIFIGGGDSFSKYDNFLSYLKNKTIRDPYGTEREDWSTRLRGDLGDGYELFQIAMPNTVNADYLAWKIWFERHFVYLRSEVVLIGCSLGGMFLAKYLAEASLPVPIKALYLLATPCGEYNDDYHNDCGSFRFNPESLHVLPDRVAQVEVWHSDDDFVVPVEHALRFKGHIPQANLRIFKGKTHFLVPELPELVEHIKQLG